MAQATVKTVQYIDPRIEPQPDPVYDYVIAPTQNQYYRIPASGRSNSSVTFNNLTTLGVDRAYLDTFELEIKAEIKFFLDGTAASTDRAGEMMPKPCDWTFDSFPFNKCCEQVHVNINGGAFFSEPLSYLRAKERYMDQWRLSRCYENICPCHKPILQTESGKEYDKAMTSEVGPHLYPPTWTRANKPEGSQNVTSVTTVYGPSVPTRLGYGNYNMAMGAEGLEGGFNNSIVRLGARSGASPNFTYEKYKRVGNVTTVEVTWREPIFCSPFSSRYDATYGRPLYNITSMDLSFTMQDLGNMIRVANISNANNQTLRIISYTIDLSSVDLCYQVMTIPPVLNKPLTTLVPYRRFVPYITDYTGAPATKPDFSGGHDGQAIKIKSGVYTMNEIPTAIWIFCAPSKRNYQENAATTYTSYTNPDATAWKDINSYGNWDSNKLFAYMTHASITMANTTQILNTAQIADLYRIAKANGCQDAFWSWAGNDICLPKPVLPQTGSLTPMFQGAGSVLRLKPGVDLIVPDQPLIPGANANNMVFQAECDFILPKHNREQFQYSLWLLFEYVGVAAISPGQCEITMNPLGSGEIIQVSPVMSATSEATEGSVDTTGGWEKIKKGASIAAQIADEGIISKILKHIPGAEKAAEWAVKHGLGEPARKRGRGTSGGAVMGHGMNEWVS